MQSKQDPPMLRTGTIVPRRSHRKSKTGCKTCKRRHIKCDEIFPQCRNCTKHEVRCGYMDQLPLGGDIWPSIDRSSLPAPPGDKPVLAMWRWPDGGSYTDIRGSPLFTQVGMSNAETRLIQHLLSMSRSLYINGTTEMTTWTTMVLKYLSVASSSRYVEHAVLALSACHLAWNSRSADDRNLQSKYGSIALCGLHHDLGSVSGANIDAILLTAVLLMIQATDWHAWSSLGKIVCSVANIMVEWKHESAFTDCATLSALQTLGDPRLVPTTPEHQSILAQLMAALACLQHHLVENSPEAYWTEQLRWLVPHFLVKEPAKTAPGRFEQLCRLRDWIHFAPCSLLQAPMADGSTTLVVAYLYATALFLEPSFLELGAYFSDAMSLPPFERIMQMVADLQTDYGTCQHRQETLRFLRHALRACKSRLLWPQQYPGNLRVSHVSDPLSMRMR